MWVTEVVTPLVDWELVGVRLQSAAAYELFVRNILCSTHRTLLAAARPVSSVEVHWEFTGVWNDQIRTIGLTMGAAAVAAVLLVLQTIWMPLTHVQLLLTLALTRHPPPHLSNRRQWQPSAGRTEA